MRGCDSPRRELRGCRRAAPPAHQRGQAAAEYVVVIAAALILIAAAGTGNPSLADQLVAALKAFWTHYSYLISLP